MKLTDEEILNSQSIQIVTNSIRVQVMLEILISSGIIDVEEFNKRVSEKYKSIEEKYGIQQEEKNNSTEKPEKIYYKHFGDIGES